MHGKMLLCAGKQSVRFRLTSHVFNVLVAEDPSVVGMRFKMSKMAVTTELPILHRSVDRNAL